MEYGIKQNVKYTVRRLMLVLLLRFNLIRYIRFYF